MANFYKGTVWRGVDYSPTWPNWSAQPGSQTGDSDFANDAFQSLWSNAVMDLPKGDPSALPVIANTTFRNDLGTIANAGFNLVRLYDWNMARGTSATSNVGRDHINFLDYADKLGLKVVVPVSDYFLSNDQYAWIGQFPDSSYSFSSAPQAIQDDFTRFVNSIIDPSTKEIHKAIHSVSVGNEGDIGQGLEGANPSEFLARTIWWIVNLNAKINNSGFTIMISATFSNADQGGQNGSWFNCLINGVAANQNTPNGSVSATFTTAVPGLAKVDSSYTGYYYNSVNIAQVNISNYTTSLQQTLAAYDSGDSAWPGKMDVPLLFMEVFAPNRVSQAGYDQAKAAVAQVTDLESYIKNNFAGTASSKTYFMGYNYFEFNDEPSQNKATGLFGYGADAPTVNTNTGVTSQFYGNLPNLGYPLYLLENNFGPGEKGSLITSITACWP